MKKYLSLVVCIFICFSASLVGALFTNTSVGGWYKTIKKPSFNPPDWIFGPVWTLLFLAMSISLWLVWQKRKEEDIKLGLIIFGVQLILNVTWSALFFGMKSPFYAFIEIVFLLFAIALTIGIFARISRLASLLLVPYFLWVGFATFLNYSIWTLNKSSL